MALKSIPPVPILDDVELGNVSSNITNNRNNVAEQEQDLGASYTHITEHDEDDDDEDRTWSENGAWSDIDSEANLNIITQEQRQQAARTSNNRRSRRGKKNRCCGRKQMRWVFVCVLTVVAVALLVLFAIWVGKAIFDRPKRKQKLLPGQQPQNGGGPNVEDEENHLCVIM